MNLRLFQGLIYSCKFSAEIVFEEYYLTHENETCLNASKNKMFHCYMKESFRIFLKELFTDIVSFIFLLNPIDFVDLKLMQ